jgi:hypothetical protein
MLTGSMILGFRLIGFVIAILLAAWVYQDAQKRGMTGIGWAIGTFFICIIFLPVYLIVRKPKLVS